MTLLSDLRSRLAPRDPETDRPIPIDARSLTSLDVERYGRTYYRHEKLGILAERPDLLPEDPRRDLPNLPVIESIDGAGNRAWRVFEYVAPDVYARLTAAPVKAGPKPSKPIDALRSLTTYRSKHEVALAGPVRSTSTAVLDGGTFAKGASASALVAGAPRADTPAAMLERFRRKGIQLRTLADGRLVASAPSGRISEAERIAIRLSARLLAPIVAGTTPAACELPGHRGEIPDAVTVVEVDVLACRAHRDGEL